MPWWKEQGPGDDATSGYCSSMAGVIARVWSVVLVLSAAATITAAWFAFAAFDTAQTSSVCAFNRLNTLAANASLNSSATAVNASEIVPMALLTEVTTNMSTYKVLAVAPAFLAALLFLLAAMHILYPRPSNPMCSKCTAGVANLPAIIAAVIYFAFAAMHSATESDWAMDQSRAFDAACNSTAVPLPNNESRPAGLLHGDVACACLLRVVPDLHALWGPGWFALLTVLATIFLALALRFIAPYGSKTAGYGRGDIYLGRVCLGEAGFVVNLLLFPFVIVWLGFDIYIAGCFKVLGTRLFRKIFGCCLGVYTDPSFTGKEALGGKGSFGTDLAKDADSIMWIRASEVPKGGGSKEGGDNKFMLYEGKIEPADLCQGAVGDCWLVAAIASASEHPASIRNAFLTPEYNPLGRYDVRLWDPDVHDWVIITVDDTIPVNKQSKREQFMKMNGRELWAVILEKAFAKYCGSYAGIDGGWAVWGWHVLTGDHCFKLRLDEQSKKWRRLNVECKRNPKREVYFRNTSEQYTPDECWNLILNYIEAQGFVAASGGKQMGSDGDGEEGGGLNGEQLNDNGLVGTHMYSILDARELGLIPGFDIGGGLLGQTKLVKMRNPWGKYEWKGAWSDTSKEWDENPIVKARLRPNLGEGADDGTFWMPFDQLVTGAAGFTAIEFCDRTTKRDLVLKAKEGMGVWGIAYGAVSGLVKFLCCCRGISVIYFGRFSARETKSTKRGCERCCSTDERNVADPGKVKADIDVKVMQTSHVM